MLDELVRQFAKEKSLTKREVEILFLLTKNVTHLKEIAAYLKLSRSTINNHLNNIYIKANVKGKAQLLAQCFGYISKRISLPKDTLTAPRALVIDGKEDPGLVLKEHLEEIGFAVVTATTPTQVMGLLEKEKIDIILSDTSMPELDGYKSLKEVRIKYPRYPLFVYDKPAS